MFQREYREEQKTIYVTGFRVGLLTSEELAGALKRLGLREERIKATIWLEELRKSAKRKRE